MSDDERGWKDDRREQERDYERDYEREHRRDGDHERDPLKGDYHRKGDRKKPYGSRGKDDARSERKRRADDEEDEYEEDLTEEELRAIERRKRQLDKEATKPTLNLKARDAKVDLESRLGKTVIVNQTTPTGTQAAGYYCETCDCVIKDSINYLDHINGRRHQRNLGMSMKVERSTLEQVRERIEWNKKRLETQKKDYNIQERMIELKEEEEKLKEYRKEKRKEKKKRQQQSNDDDQDNEQNDEMMRLMGFASFQ